jgi:hypothetical protein
MTAIEGSELDHERALAWYTKWIGVWNSHEPSRVRGLITDDFRLVTPTTVATGAVLNTATQAEAYMRFVINAYPDLVWTQAGPATFADHDPVMIVPWHGEGTFGGVIDPPGIQGTGKAFAFDGVEVFRFRGDIADGVTAHYDLQGLMRQVLPGKTR